MKFKKFLIIFLLVALLSAFSFNCFAAGEQYFFSVPAGTYVFDEVLDFSGLVDNMSAVGSVSCGSHFANGFAFDITNNSEYLILLGGKVIYDNSWVYGNVIVVNEVLKFYSPVFYQWFLQSSTKLDSGYEFNFFHEMLFIFTAIGKWISGAAGNLTAMFFVDNSLTFVGTLSIAALSMAVVFLIIGLISRFLRFKA